MNWNPFKRGHHGSRQGNPDTGSGAAAPLGADDAFAAIQRSIAAALTAGAVYTGSVYSTSDAGTRPRVTLPTEARDREIVAWRGWQICRAPNRNAYLLSYYNQTMWRGPTLKAHQKPQPERPDPDRRAMAMYGGGGHGPGIYAVHAALFADSSYNESLVTGEVALSGRVIEHEHGYRAERATIRRLWLRTDWARALNEKGVQAELTRCGMYDMSPLTVAGELADRYQCEVELLTGDARPWMDGAA